MKKAFFEAAFVVLGVVLALLANEWRQWRGDQAHAREAFMSIEEELGANRLSLTQSRDYHSAQLTMLREIDPNERLDVGQFSRGFIFPALLSRSALDAAAETGALSNLRFEQVLEIGSLYAQQDAYQRQAEANATILYRTLFESGYDGVLKNARGLTTMIGAFAYRESQLIESYDEFLQKTHDGDELGPE